MWGVGSTVTGTVGVGSIGVGSIITGPGPKQRPVVKHVGGLQRDQPYFNSIKIRTNSSSDSTGAEKTGAKAEVMTTSMEMNLKDVCIV